MNNLPMWAPRFRVQGGVLQYKPFPSYYTWLDAWDVTAALATAGAVSLYELPFSFDGTYPLILLTVPALATITNVRCHIELPFDAPTTIAVGDDLDTSRLFAAENSNPTEVGTYEVATDYEYSAQTALILSIACPGATQGAGRIVIQYDRE